MEHEPGRTGSVAPPGPGHAEPGGAAEVPPFALATAPHHLPGPEDPTQFQLVVDHVKDAILTVGPSGRIETMNRTAERVFGYDEATARGRKLDQLIPSLSRTGALVESLDELADSIDDTQIDLSPRETRGRRADGTLFDAEIGVSKVRLDRRQVYVVCLRDTTERKLAEAALRDSEARYRTLVENAPEAIVVYDADLDRFVECNDNAVRFFKMTRDELLALGPEALSAPDQADGPLHLVSSRGYIARALDGETPASTGCTGTHSGTTSPARCDSCGCPRAAGAWSAAASSTSRSASAPNSWSPANAASSNASRAMRTSRPRSSRSPRRPSA